jgi:F0F1-type ATP synthase assembly protein I
MQTWHIILIVVFVFGIILGNILLLRSTANTKMPVIKKKDTNEQKENDDDW